MDIIGALASQFGVDEDAAKAIAGTALGSVQSAIKNDAGDDAADGMGSAVPEIGSWRDKASVVLEGGGEESGLLGGLLGGGGGDLLSSVVGSLGGEQAKEMVTLVALLGKLGIDPEKASMAAPFILDFLKARLSPELLNTALSAAPALLGAVGGEQGEEGGIGDLIGGLFGK